MFFGFCSGRNRFGLVELEKWIDFVGHPVFVEHPVFVGHPVVAYCFMLHRYITLLHYIPFVTAFLTPLHYIRHYFPTLHYVTAFLHYITSLLFSLHYITFVTTFLTSLHYFCGMGIILWPNNCGVRRVGWVGPIRG